MPSALKPVPTRFPVQYLPISTVVSNAENPRKISDKAFRALVKSLKESPELFDARPLLCSTRTGKPVVLGGNMRLRAAFQLNYKTVPCVLLPHLSQKQERKLIIKDNGQWGEWDWDMLEKDFKDLPLSDYGVDLPKNWLGADTPAPSESLAVAFQSGTELVAIADLKPHPKNYRKHPEDQIAHIIESIKEHGIYRNAVIAKDGTILAGHGMIQAASKAGMDMIPAIRLDVDPHSPRALKILIGDNEFAHLAEIDDRMLTDLLKLVKDSDEAGLLGTGFDEKMLAALAFISRPESEIKGHDEAAHWVGMPEYVPVGERWRIVVNFRTEEEMNAFAKEHGMTLTMRGTVRTTWWPPRENADVTSVAFVQEETTAPA